MQPAALFDEMEWVEGSLGTGRSRFVHAHRSLKNHGAVLAFSSDWPVSSIDPMGGLYAAVTRQDTSGFPVEGFHPRERITMEEAIEAYTWGSAAAEGRETEKGTLEAGKLADVVILDRDPIIVPAREVLKIDAVLTILGGRVIHNTLNR
jgi:predicted amidohydrolase YtcJ